MASFEDFVHVLKEILIFLAFLYKETKGREGKKKHLKMSRTH